jgi:hypothetical protein
MYPSPETDVPRYLARLERYKAQLEAVRRLVAGAPGAGQPL